MHEKPSSTAVSHRFAPVLAAIAALTLLVPLILAPGTARGEPAPAAQSRGREPIRPLMAPVDIDRRKADLGRRLFDDPILSRDGTMSCRSCHELTRGGADSLAVALGVGGARGSVNTPTVYNAALNLAQFWDGRARSLEEQAGGPITNPLEMGSDWPGILERLKASPYRTAFQDAFGGEPTADRVQEAIAIFERTLVTTGSRFDAWLLGDESALSPDEKRGYALFKSYGCVSCHQGAGVGGNMFQRFGFFGNLFTDRAGGSPADLGRYNVTKRDADRHVFKVPSLRMAVFTAPYFHDGSVPTLTEAVRLMGRYQLGHDIADDDIGLIIQFLGTLPGTMVEDGP